MTGNQLKAARALAGIDQVKLAELAGLSVNTIRNMEAAGASVMRIRVDTLNKAKTALESAGVAFIRTAGVRLKCEPVQWIDEWTLYDCYEGDGRPRSYYISRMEQRDGIALADLVSPKTEDREEAERWARSGIWTGIDE